MIRFICIIAILFQILKAQDWPIPGFDYKTFDLNTKTAEYLARYDRVAWITTDLLQESFPNVMQQMGPEWFCVPQAFGWKAVFGKYYPDEDIYKPLQSFNYDSKGAAKAIESEIPNELETAFARSIHRSYATMIKTMKATRIPLNWYVIQDSITHEITVWYLTGMSTDGLLNYGGEYSFKFDASGRQLLDSTWYYQKYRQVNPDSSETVVLDFYDQSMPSIGSLFLACRFGSWFHLLIVRTSQVSVSYPSKFGLNWVLVPKH